MVKGDGDAKASAIYAQAFGQSPEFYAFYRSLEAYRSSFKSKSDVMVVEPSSEFFKYLKGRWWALGAWRNPIRARAGSNGAYPDHRVCTDAGAGRLIPFVAPATWRETFARLIRMADGQIRFVGLGSMVLGLVILIVFS
jgi:uncharacterized protein YjeT (DUF2065 family)